MKKRIVHYIKKPFDNIALCRVDVRGGFSSLNIENINCEKCLSKLQSLVSGGKNDRN